jgi:hypothetical protein
MICSSIGPDRGSAASASENNRSRRVGSAKLFLQSSELGLPQPLTRKRVAHWRERGWKSPNSNDGTYTVILFVYAYFVIAARRSLR